MVRSLGLRQQPNQSGANLQSGYFQFSQPARRQFSLVCLLSSGRLLRELLSDAVLKSEKTFKTSYSFGYCLAVKPHDKILYYY